MSSHIDLSHTITHGMVTYPGLPAPQIADHLTRKAAEEIYGPGLTFQIGLVTMCTNTGTYLDVPFHRYADGHDLTELALERVAGVDAVKIVIRDEVAIDVSEETLANIGRSVGGLAGKAVLVETGHSDKWGTDAYFEKHPALTAATAERLRDAEVACVGIDSLNIDATDTGDRPVHSILLGSNIPIIEHLTGLHQLPAAGFRFTAVPPKIQGAGTFTVRAFATPG
jgi:kynurenine formamidase